MEDHAEVKLSSGELITDTRHNFGLELTIDEETFKEKIAELEGEADENDKHLKAALDLLKALKAQLDTAFQDAKADSDEETAIIKLMSLTDDIVEELQ